jgi:hypothetical protein
MEVLRKCRYCGVEAYCEEELALFVKRSTKPYGRDPVCKKCQNKRLRKYHKENPHKRRETELKRNYDITLDDYNKMFKEQKGCCKICGTHQKELKKPLFVDHCHTTNDVRGLLCTHCNVLLGMAKDNINILDKAKDYLLTQETYKGK